MNALVYHGPGKKSWDKVPDPAIQQPTDAIGSSDLTTICGTDLHILKGDVPETKRGTILGHEAVGTIVEVGSAVTTVQIGDHVLLSWISSCGRCASCKPGRRGGDLRPHDRRDTGRLRSRPVRGYVRLQDPRGPDR